MQLDHPVFGTVEVSVNLRARRFLFRFNDEGTLLMTVPPHTCEKEWKRVLDEMTPKLLVLQKKKGSVKKVTPDFSIMQPDFRMKLREGMVPRVQARMSEGTLDIVYPPRTDFENEDLQKWFVRVGEEALRHQAKRLLPDRLYAWAERYNLEVESVTIRNSHGRWGSCSSRKSINLSLYLILLPHHLQDYVILHELTHTLHMDHSASFWKQLDIFCGTSSKKLRKELAAYQTSLFFKRG